MQPAKLERPGLPKSESKTLGPAEKDVEHAAAYIQDMAISMRGLALKHNMATLGLLLEMASVEASGFRKR